MPSPLRALASVAPTVLGLLLCALTQPAALRAAERPEPQTTVAIRGGDFLLTGHPTYEGRTWRGHRVEGLLMNNRVVQGTFDDLNPETVRRWAYPDTGVWDAGRNHREFLAACVAEHVSWGWFDWRRPGESFDEGYQSLPVNWSMSSARKRAFHAKIAEITGYTPATP